MNGPPGIGHREIGPLALSWGNRERLWSTVVSMLAAFLAAVTVPAQAVIPDKPAGMQVILQGVEADPANEAESPAHRHSLSAACRRAMLWDGAERVAVTPALALEHVVEPVARIANAINDRRLQAVLGVPAGSAAMAVRGAFAGTFGNRRRELLELIDRGALRRVWPGGLTASELEVELFVRRRLGVETAAAIAPLGSIARDLFGRQARGRAEFAPVGYDERSRRGYALLALAGSDTSGALPMLLRSIGDGSEPGADPGARQLRWLALVERTVAVHERRQRVMPKNAFRGRWGGKARAEFDADFYVLGRLREWQSLQAGTRALRAVLDLLNEYERTHGGARTRFYRPLFDGIEELEKQLDVAIGALARAAAARAGDADAEELQPAVLHRDEADVLLSWFEDPLWATTREPDLPLPFGVARRDLPRRQGDIVWFDYVAAAVDPAKADRSSPSGGSSK
ncbi:MAG: hypothetical protein NXI31_07515 [bacterium]|nr:hypothetical protein [bacterium]